ncbi:MAG: helix-turn-helix domain-containing protein [Clostridiales bacterium]|nr:helix-turn-helix domain-containing protein [Clostridiales bacterium]
MLGDYIRKMRKEQGLTLKELADLAELSPGYISQIERGFAEPSLTSFQKIAEALKIPPMLMLEDKPQSKGLHIPREKQPIVTIPESDSVTYRICTQLPNNEFMPSNLVLAFFIKPHSQDFPKPIYHDTEETIIVTKGEVTVVRMGEEVFLNTGDTLLLEKNVPHVIINNSDEVAEGFSIMTPAIWSLNS